MFSELKRNGSNLLKQHVLEWEIEKNESCRVFIQVLMDVCLWLESIPVLPGMSAHVCGHVCLLWTEVCQSSGMGKDVGSSGWGRVPDEVHSIEYMYLLLVLGTYMHLWTCRGIVYGGSVICIVCFMPFHVHIYVPGWFFSCY